MDVAGHVAKQWHVVVKGQVAAERRAAAVGDDYSEDEVEDGAIQRKIRFEALVVTSRHNDAVCCVAVVRILEEWRPGAHLRPVHV